MKKVLPLIPVLLLLSTPLLAQEDSVFTLLRTIKGNIVDFTADNLDNVYLFTSTDQLKKLNANGDSVGIYNNVRKFGKVSYIDVSNPLRVLLYYKDFATIVVLDRLLNVRNTIDLRQQNIFQAQAVGLSYDNKIWVYDELENKLKKIDEDGKLLFETPDFRQLFEQSPAPSTICDQDGFIYLYDSLRGVFVFDYYGNLKNKILLTGWKDFRVVGKYLYGIKNDSLLRYQPSVFSSQALLLPPRFRQAATVSFTPARAYAMKKDELEIYSLR